MQKVELLSPAGTLEKLKIAIDFGADAVYGGVSHFSLRIRSGKEFSMDEFAEGIEYAHSRGKKVYATLNGFPFNSQLNLLKKHILAMADLGPDAFIVATPGVLKLCHDLVPHMPLHLSTQANVMNVLDAKVYCDMGATRIITAREISLRDLVEIKKELPDLELEVFVHGSMCFAYSGRCLISTLQSGRVPNRGSCANDCRFPYEMYAANPETGTLFRLEEEEGVGTYIMNSKDLNLASHLKEILDSGAVDSIKVEGRTKTAYYAAVTAKAYRMAIDDYYNGINDVEKYQYELQSLQNRGYTDAYLISRPFEKHDTQSLDFTMQLGTHQVSGVVNEEGTHFLCKYKTLPNDELEIVAPLNSVIEIVDNEIGTTYERDGRVYMKLKQLLAQNRKVWDEVHSGNINPITLPTKLPPYTFLRIPATADMGTYPKV
ncbi:MAG: protease [Sulfurimonas sp. RIFCSPHIGHO2_12_FULL_36_9]|uniref:peptidase U32 family protein n=1 Tax=Sulfurimonas sp. RIFCSPLOWO2_12_36_12 TaxID=1802253 RepID=UPI0008BAEDF3|nr:peptidase U32 family protein [Sulfurimonas sp. RIFCSPLOWO2_12_36_12]OHD96926.1 MAG: protease [Sulfurimonas sp. RIFCSPLOWO2_02_FULL_36_28]OHD99175.1 MAG: protease [Sulfurimonas sp. RIFCSPHIGHO2_12_FULL_36_9]OHE02162.1 MAG: protease [Sulfurimonas sp. RIFCSPLOWO2_12_36_12]OHE08613.1 MAG: protease [Sulfurimonas sp. RIFCSPLOWO2_12_FULL_36_74]